MRAAVFVFVMLIPSAVAASDAWSPSAGVRVGGYGFRHAADSDLAWDDCRMNGVGALVRLDRAAPWYLQVSVDGYHATGETVAAGMDRLSLTPAAAIGARLQNRTPILPHIELGLGAEFTRVELGDAAAARVLPTGYVGAGVELVFGSIAFGTTIRANWMGLPEHGDTAGASAGSASALSSDAASERGEAPTAKHEHGSGEGAHEVRFRPELSGQMTFSLRYSF